MGKILEMDDILVVGDIHAKHWVVEKVSRLIDEYDKVIFLGDYVDDWTAPPDASIAVITALRTLKLSKPDKIVLLIGNHDAQYLFGEKFKCSGFNRELQKPVRKLLLDSSLVQFAYAHNDHLFTHAGVTSRFWEFYSLLARTIWPNLPKEPTAETVAFFLNESLKAHLTNPTETSEKLFHMFAQVGVKRGGSSFPSPLWADKEELEADRSPLPFCQVVGHTPVGTITHKADLTFCDTLSSWYSPITGLEGPLGDKSLLSLEFVNGDTTLKTLTKANWLWSE